ncbi:MAG: CDP-diacylglycerol--serine O-phosphatidyltransferase [Bacteroidales bacterium]
MTGLGLSSDNSGDFIRTRHLRLLGPLRRRTDRRPGRPRRGVFLLPSAFTLANLFCGYACVVYAMRGEFETAAPFIGFAIVLDMLDGRIARMTGTATEFGVQFDSLADVVSFGVAPAILTFTWGLAPLGRLGWAAGFVFVTAAAVRLARFNIQHVTDKRYFVGMPSPAAAAVLASTVYAFPSGIRFYGEAMPVLTIVLVPAFLMVSTIRFRSFKTLNMHARYSPAVLLLLALGLAAIATHPREVLVVLAYAYLASAFVGLAVTRLRRRWGKPAGAAPADTRGVDAVGGAPKADG